MEKELNTNKKAENQACVSGSLSANTRYAIQVDKMKHSIIELVDDCFNRDTDPEVQWMYFREQLTHYKREQILAYLETDVF